MESEIPEVRPTEDDLWEIRNKPAGEITEEEWDRIDYLIGLHRHALRWLRQFMKKVDRLER